MIMKRHVMKEAALLGALLFGTISIDANADAPPPESEPAKRPAVGSTVGVQGKLAMAQVGDSRRVFVVEGEDDKRYYLVGGFEDDIKPGARVYISGTVLEDPPTGKPHDNDIPISLTKIKEIAPR